MNRNFTLEYKNPLLEDDCVRLQRHLEENAFRAIAIFLVHMVLCPVVILGNAAILLTIWKTPSLHTPAYMLLANLAVSDFATGLLLQPFVITIVLSASFGISPSTFRFLCAGFGALACVLVGVSVLTITAIALDRLLALRLHLRYSVIVTKFRVNVVITTIWLLQFLQGLSLLLFYTKSQKTESIFAIALCVLLLVNFKIYLNIYRIVRRHQLQIHQQQPGENSGIICRLIRLKKSAVNTFLVFIVLLVSYMPYICVVLRGEKVSYAGYHIVTSMIVLNSSLNPLFCCWRVREIRAATKQLICL